MYPPTHQPHPSTHAPTPAPTTSTQPDLSTQPEPGTPHDAERLDATLVQLEAARAAQHREAVRCCAGDAVSVAYRDSVERALEEVRTARQRLAEGLYGWCRCCAKRIPGRRLQLLPSTSLCVRCAVHTRGT